MRRTTIALAGLLVLAACGTPGNPTDDSNSNGTTPGPGALAAAASSTLDAGSAQVVMRQESSFAEQETFSEANGVVDFESGAMEATMELQAPGVSSQEFDVRVVDLVGYFESSFIPGLPGDEAWVMFDFAELGDEAGLDVEALMQTGEDQLAYLEEVSDVERVGRETVRGVDTTRYTFTTDFEELAESGPEDLRDSLRVLIDDFGFTESPGEVWLDDDGLVRRVGYNVEGDGLAMDTTIEYFEFGVDVDVRAPPESETVNIMDLAPPTKTKTKA